MRTQEYPWIVQPAGYSAVEGSMGHHVWFGNKETGQGTLNPKPCSTTAVPAQKKKKKAAKGEGTSSATPKKVKPFVCSYCCSRFMLQANLESHEQSHTGGNLQF